jgi:2-polyprenyl-3-methyl-5-hydroxy-6-metoxy-1,4-benzoquinol methylase
MIVYGCMVSDEERFRRWAGMGMSRVMQPGDMSALSDAAPLAAAYDEIVAAMRGRPDCEAVVLVEQDVEITEPHFAACVARRLREPRTEVLIVGDGAIVALGPAALGYASFTEAGTSAADLATAVAVQAREHGHDVVRDGLAFRRPGNESAPAPRAASGAGRCPICGEPLPLHRANAVYAVVECRACGVGVTVPEPTRDIESAGIWEEQYGGNRLDHRAQWLKEGERRVDWVTRHRTGGMLVDVGCGTGELVTTAAARGFHALGIEPSAWGAAQARELAGVAAILPSVDAWEDACPDRWADVVTLFHVLEHVHEPLGFLQGLRRILAPDGLLFIEVPHFGSAAARRDPVAWTGTAISDHVLHYTEQSLGRVLRDAGFRVIESTPMPSMVYDDMVTWAARSQEWLAEGHLAPPEDLLRVLAEPVCA